MATQYGFYINTDRCVQCHACEVACKTWNRVEPGIKWRQVVEFWEGEFPKVKNQTISYSCLHCEKPACIEVCPSGALAKRAQDGIVTVDSGKCIACRSCASACPFHIPQYGKTRVMQKCNLCLDRLAQGKQPLCVETCPGEALKFGTLEQLAEMSAARSGVRIAAATLPSLWISGALTGERFLARFGGQ